MNEGVILADKKLGSVLAALALALVATASASALSRPEVISLLVLAPGESTSIPPFSEDAVPPVGARVFFRNSLYKWAGTRRGERVGRLEGTCTITGHDKRSVSAYCTEEASLPAGQILAAGFIRFTESGIFDLPVIGGTGRYGNARGWLRIKDLPTGNTSFVFHLIP